MRPAPFHRVASMLAGGLLALALLVAPACKPRDAATNTDGGEVRNTTNDGLPANFGAADTNGGPGLSNATEPVNNNDAPWRNSFPANTANPPANSDTPQTRPAPTPFDNSARYEPSAEERLRERVAALTMDYSWPRGMYPFGLRKPAPPEQAMEDNTLWQFIYAAHAMHRRARYEEAQQYLEFAAARDLSGDSILVEFNLGACRYELSREKPELLAKAVDAWRKCLTIDPATTGDASWAGAAFKHFAAGALARVEMARGSRPDAIAYGISSVVKWPPEDPFTGRPLPNSAAAERLLPLLWMYGGADIKMESPAGLVHLLTDRRPTLVALQEDELTAAFFVSCVQNRTDTDDDPESGAPGCYRREFLQIFAANWLADFKDSKRRGEVEAAARRLGN